ncbi:hypothetical protein HHI36_007067 [Cryptolaemus montrouzieri]|uniref:Peptidoglycan-recognition protein n=1 Tax=Cryptolaemus montrouzieri TaxID=559131 RepID=A0ABD2MNJ3_9CUCU
MKSLLVGLLCAFWRVQGDVPAKCPEIISKSRWGARLPLEVEYALIPIQYVVVHHTVTPTCTTEAKCSELLKNIQNFHMDEMEFHDIGYNFMVGGDGNIYEGAGWHKVGAHTYGYNSKSLGLAFVGNFTENLPEVVQLEAAKKFLECGVQLGELDEKYKLLGARQVSSTQSPGLKLYWELKHWNHWSKTP